MRTRRQKVFSVLVACLLCASFFTVPVSAAESVLLYEFNTSGMIENWESSTFEFNSGNCTELDIRLCVGSTYYLLDNISLIEKSASENLIVNGDFENGAAGWSIDVGSDDFGDVCVLPDATMDGEYGALIHGTGFNGISQKVKVKTNTDYVVSFFRYILSEGGSLAVYVYGVPESELSPAPTQQSFLSTVGIFFAQSMDWLGDVLSIVVSTPALLIFTIAFVICGFAVALLDRMKKQ